MIKRLNANSEFAKLDLIVNVTRHQDGIVTYALFTCQARQASAGSDEQNQ